MADAVRIEGIDRIMRKVTTLKQMRGARRGLRAGAVHILGKIKPYATATIANSPSNPSGRWYLRGFGPRWRRKDGTTGGRKTSETLGRKWTIQQKNGGFTQIIGNNVSYGPYVHSAKKQAGFHADRGWKTDEQVVKEESERVLNFIAAEVRRDLAS